MKKKILPIFFFVILLFVVISPQKVDAFSLSDLFDKVKSIFIKEVEKKVEIKSKISIVPEGDKNNDAQINTGDTIRFNFEIINPTETEYIFSTLNTGILRNSITSIHNVRAVSLEEQDGFIVFPNLRLLPMQILQISFDAQTLFSTNKDIDVGLEATFLDREKNVIAESESKVIKALKVEDMNNNVDQFSIKEKTQ